jgi:hypothetical protein
VPIDMAYRQKFKKKGIKLHIYNDHTFVAKHLKGYVRCSIAKFDSTLKQIDLIDFRGMLCHVCNKIFAYRPGKQGYECRDCLLQCHKPCHVRTPQSCPNPKILSMQL